MNGQISTDRRKAPLEDRLDALTAVVPAATMLIGGAGDPRPAAAIERLGRQLRRPTVIIPEAGHEPWLEQPDLFKLELRSAVSKTSVPSCRSASVSTGVRAEVRQQRNPLDRSE